MAKFYAVVLAAGSSTRLGFNKLFVRVDGETIIRRSVNLFRKDFIDKVFVVAGAEKERLEQELGDIPCEVIPNVRHLEGMSSSVKAAMPYVMEADAIFFHLGDKPLVRDEMPAMMARAYADHHCSILVPIWNGKRGHPVLMSIKPYMNELVHLSGDKGLREVIENHLADVVFIEGDEGSVFDVDTIDHIGVLRKRGHVVEEG